MSRFAGKKAVVIGGTHGMGLAVTKALTDGGAEVVVTGHNERHGDLAQAELGSAAHVVRSDATDLAAIDELAGTVHAVLGTIDFLHVNVGFARLEPFHEVTEASLTSRSTSTRRVRSSTCSGSRHSSMTEAPSSSRRPSRTRADHPA